MVGTNDFIWYARNGVDNVNVRLQATYAADGQTAVGHGAGIVSELDFNKTMRQATAASAWIAQYMAQVLNANVVDDGNLNTHLVQFWDALLAGAYFVDSGSASAIVIAAPAGLTFPAPIAGMSVIVKAAAAPTGATNLNWMGNGNIAVRWSDGSAVGLNDWSTNALLHLTYDGTFWRMLSAPVNAMRNLILNFKDQIFFTSSGTWTVPANVTRFRARLWGAGGGGGGTGAAADVAAGGGGGEYREGFFTTTPGLGLGITIGAGGVAGTSTVNGGAGGNTVLGNGSGGTLCQANGGLGGQSSNGAGVATGYGLGGTGGSGGTFVVAGCFGGYGYGYLTTGTGIVIPGVGGPSYGFGSQPLNVGAVTGATASSAGQFPGVAGNGSAGGIIGAPGFRGQMVIDY